MTSERRRLLKVFIHMKERCYDPNNSRYKDWGGRGIGICREWLNNPDLFVQWSIDNGYSAGLTIDRINNDKDYSPDNCRWVTVKENNQNRRSSRYYTIDGKTQVLQKWCDDFNMSRSIVNKRLEMGWDIEKALTTPKKERDTASLVGEKFGKLTVLEFVGKSKFRQSLFKCACDCGNYCVVDSNKLKTGHTTSCGCYRKEIAKNNFPDNG